MAIAMDGQVFDDEWEYTAHQLAPSGQIEPNLSQTQNNAPRARTPEGQLIPRIRVTPFDRSSIPTSPQPPASSDIEDRRSDYFFQPFVDTFKNAASSLIEHPFTSEAEYRKRPPFELKEPLSTQAGVHDVENTPLPPASNSSDWTEEEKNKYQQYPQPVMQSSPEVVTTVPDNKPDLTSYSGRLKFLYQNLTGTGGQERHETIPENIVKGLISGFTLPGDVKAGKVAAGSDEAIGRAAELASAVVMGPAPIASKIADGTLGSFAGVKSLTARRGDLDLATQMAEKKMPTDQIYNATGWFQGLDKKWRYEIPDHKAQFTNQFADRAEESIGRGNYLSTNYLGEWFKHPDLYKAYPQLKDVRLRIDNQLTSLGAYTHEAKGGPVISINLNKILDNPEIHPLEVVMHEIQHAVQRQEGFFSGTSVSGAMSDALSYLDKRLTDIATKDVRSGEKFDPEKIRSQVQERMNSNEYKRIYALKKLFEEDPEKGLEDFGMSSIARGLYKDNPGEIEARAVGARATQSNARSMTPMQSLEHEGDPLIIPGADKAASAESNVVNHPRMGAANENVALKTLSDDELEKQLRTAHLEYSKGISLVDKSKNEGTRLPRDFIELRRTTNQRYHELFMERQRRMHEKSDLEMEQINQDWAEIIKQQKEDAKQALKKSLKIVPNEDK